MRRNSSRIHRTKSILIIAIMLTLLSSIPKNPSTLGAPQNYVALIDTAHMNAPLNLTSLNQTAQSMNVKLESVSSLQAPPVLQAKLLLIIAPQANYTTTDISSIQTFLSGGGSIWITGGGSYETSSLYINRLLNQLGSDMRLEQAYLEDPTTNRNSTQLDSLELVVPILNHSYNHPEARNITQDVRVLEAYKPVPILGWNGAYTAADDLNQIDSRWLASSSPSSLRSSTNTLSALFIGSQPQSEKIIVSESIGGGHIVAFGSPIFSDLLNMFQYSPQHPEDNSAFIVNLLKSELKISSDFTVEPSITEKTSPATRKLVIDLSHSAIHKNSTEYTPFKSLLDTYGFQTEISTSPITSNLISDALALVIVSPNSTLSSAELNATRAWFKQGQHFLWLASGADNPNADTNASTNTNLILQDINSTLRFELGTVIDGGVNVASQPYLVLSSILNRDAGLAQNFTRNVRSLYFYSPTNIAGWLSNGTIVRLENQLTNFPSVTWLARSSNASKVTNLDSKHKLLAYNGTAPTSLILSASEKISASTLLMTGSSLFLNFQQMFRYPTLYGYPQDNNIYARNVLLQILQHYVNSTSLTTSLTRLSDIQGNPVTLHIQYQAKYLNLQTLDTSKLQPVPNPSITPIIASTTLTASKLANGTFTATTTISNSGSFTYSLTASSKGYANQSASGNIDVKPLPTRFAIYVLTIPPLIFIATTIVYLTRKGRFR